MAFSINKNKKEFLVAGADFSIYLHFYIVCVFPILMFLHLPYFYILYYSVADQVTY
jgi:hypothetical protein